MVVKREGLRRVLWGAARWTAIASMVAIGVLSTLPGPMRLHTGFPGNAEHFVAYAGAAALIQLGLPKLRRWREAALLSVAAAVFEALQIWIPGRSPGVDNWAASTAGAVAGMFAGLAILHFVSARFGPPD